MKWEDAEPLARFGQPVRRSSAPVTRSYVFLPGAGTSREVLVLRNGPTETVASAADFGTAEYAADDWVIAT